MRKIFHSVWQALLGALNQVQVGDRAQKREDEVLELGEINIFSEREGAAT